MERDLVKAYSAYKSTIETAAQQLTPNKILELNVPAQVRRDLWEKKIEIDEDKEYENNKEWKERGVI